MENDDNMINAERKRSWNERNVRSARDAALNEVVVDESLRVEVFDGRRVPFFESSARRDDRHE